MSKKEQKVGDLRVWHIPQIPGKPFYVPVESVAEGVKVMDLLNLYDDFQFKNRIKGDYASVNGLEVLEPDCDGEELEWVSWMDYETGIDCPREWLEEQR